MERYSFMSYRIEDSRRATRIYNRANVQLVDAIDE